MSNMCFGMIKQVDVWAKTRVGKLECCNVDLSEFCCTKFTPKMQKNARNAAFSCVCVVNRLICCVFVVAAFLPCPSLPCQHFAKRVQVIV